jgi:hypothetical protein
MTSKMTERSNGRIGAARDLGISGITIRRTNRGRVLKLAVALVVMVLGFAGEGFPAPPEDAPIWRLQMRLRIADIEDAGTDDDVRVQLNSRNSTWLDYGRDDFERNDTFTYDLGMVGIRKISDLEYIRISKTGDDGLALKSFVLLVNGREIYMHSFAGAGHWLDNAAGYSRMYVVSTCAMATEDLS